MKTKYSEEIKASIIAKLLPPNNANVPEVAQETGIPKDTLYGWRLKYRNAHGAPAAANDQQAGQFNNEEKLAVVIEIASLSEVELGEYCRRKGLYPEQIAGWKKSFIQGGAPGASKAERAQTRQQNQTIKKLQSELRRKEKALAEAAALLVLEKKFQALWEDPEDEKSNSESAKK